MIYDTNFQDNNSKLQSLLNKVNASPDDEGEMVVEVIDGVISIAETTNQKQNKNYMTLCYTDSSSMMQTVNAEFFPFQLSVAKGTLIFVVKNGIELADNLTNCSKIYAQDDGCIVFRADDNNFNITFYA